MKGLDLPQHINDTLLLSSGPLERTPLTLLLSVVAADCLAESKNPQLARPVAMCKQPLSASRPVRELHLPSHATYTTTRHSSC